MATKATFDRSLSGKESGYGHPTLRQRRQALESPLLHHLGVQAFSIFGSQLVQFALIWHLTVTTDSATVLATAVLVGMLPNVLLGPLVGALVDRWDRRRIMLIADGSMALATLTLALLFALDAAATWHIDAVMFIRSLASAFHGNATEPEELR